MKQFLFFSILLAVLNVNAQTKFGVQGAVLASRSKVGGTYALDIYSGRPQLLTGYKFGVFAEIKLKSKLCFNPEINYLFKGSKYSKHTNFHDVSYTDVKRTIKTEYLEVPLNVCYKFKKNGGSFFAGGGPVIAFGFRGKEESSYYQTPAYIIYTINDEIKFDGKEQPQFAVSHFQVVEFGLNIAAGYEFKSGVRFNIQFRPNFNDIAPGESKKYRNMYVGLNLGFGL